MIERDFIMRMLQDFFSLIAKFLRMKLEDPDMTLTQARFDELYKQFFRRTAEYFYATDKENLPDALKKEELSDTELYAMMQMLAELLYQDGLIKKDIAEKCMLLEKSLFLLQYLECNSKTFSWEREQKMGDILKILTEYETK
jgi:hypothetical protein